MASAAGLRPNHYEVLGLSPKASEHEIGQAFATIMGKFGAHSVAAAAQLSVAFEVLRDPVRRRAYDRALGLIKEPQPRQWSIAASVGGSPALIGSAWSRLTEEAAASTLARPISEAAPKPQKQPEPRRRDSAPAEPTLPSFLGSPIRRASGAPVPEPRLEELLAAEVASSGRDAEERPIDWRRPVLAVGGLVLAAGLIGTFAGLSVKGSEDPSSAGADVTVPVPPARQHAKVAAQAVAPVAAEETITQAPVHAATAPVVQPRRRSPRSTFAETAVEQAPAVAAEAQDSPPVESADDTLAPLPETAAAAAMPLPKQVIARTIDRIGYSCGTVVSTADAGSGVYNVTCSSGQSYQATPVHGRYRFRRSSH